MKTGRRPWKPSAQRRILQIQPQGSDLEIVEVLKADLNRRLGHQPVASWVAHLLARTPPDVEVRRAAAQALLRRVAASKRLEAKLKKKAEGHYLLTALPRREYLLTIYSDEPFIGSCTCADFSRNGLGVCKHLWALLDQVAPDRRGVAPKPQLVWFPERAWTGKAPLHEGFRLQLVKGQRVPRGWVFCDDRIARLESDTFDGARGALQSALAATDAIDPAARQIATELLLHEQEQPTRVALAQIAEFEPSLKRPLFPFQREGVARLICSERLLLGDDMGLGKTTQAITAAALLHASGRARRALLVVPASLKPQWAREWQAVSRHPITVIDGGPHERTEAYRRAGEDILLVNYEQVIRDYAAISRWGPELVVLDEAQRIKNWETKTALTLKQLKPKYRWVLTGTPFENRLEELASLVEWLDDRALEPKWRLSCFHSVRSDGQTAVVGAKNLDTLRARLTHCLLRRTKEEVLPELPERIDTPVNVALTDEQRGMHADLVVPIARLLSIRHRRPLTQAEFLRLMSLLNEQRMICNAAVLPNHGEYWDELSKESPRHHLKLLHSPKLEEFRELIGQVALAQHQKVVVFSQWRRMLQWANWSVSDLLSAKGKRAVFFTGQESQRRRTENLVDFHDDPNTCVMFLTDAGGVGLNLQHAASVMVNLEYPWNPAVLEQRVGRIHRHGQTRPVQIYLFGASEGIESRVSNLVGDKRALFKGLFDGDHDAVDFAQSGSFLEKIETHVAVADELAIEQTEEDTDEGLDSAADVADVKDETEAQAADSPVHEARPPAQALRPSTSGSTPDTPALPDPASWLRELKIERTREGSIKIEATGTAAQNLAAVFQGLAHMLAPPPT